MNSHTYQVRTEKLAAFLARPAILLVGMALLVHVARDWGWLPRARPAVDVDRTVLVHQVEASRQRSDATWVLLGDSSCLMDVDATVLSQRLGEPVLNLGTLSYLDLNAHATLLKSFFQANPGQVRTVLILLHPEALRRVGPQSGMTRTFHAICDGEEVHGGGGFHEGLSQAMGLLAVRDRLLSRWVPVPLAGAFRSSYGFCTELERHLAAHRGSLLDPGRPLPRGSDGQVQFAGSPEYRLAAQMEAPSRNLRAAIPDGVRILAGITPIPESFAGRDYVDKRHRMLLRWCDWLGIQAELDSLPAMLPDEMFASVSHLNAAGVRLFTERLAVVLAER